MNSHDYREIQKIKRYRTRVLARIIGRSLMLYRRKNYDGMYHMICTEFMNLGGVYIKFLQGVLLRSEFMRRWKSDDRLRVFENLDTEPIDILPFLQKELPADRLAQIASINPVPFAAGSFGQVYFGQHVDGTQIIVKVLRPLIRETLKFDLRLLGIFMKQFNKRLTKDIMMDLKKPIEDFKAATLRETDYVGEAEFAAEMYETYKDHPTFVVPRTYLDLCTRNVITQEYVGGISVADVIKAKEQNGIEPKEYVRHYTGSNLSEQLETLGYESLLGVFYLPRIQGDPHPGNIRLLPDNKVGLIDFGIFARTPKEKPAIFGLIEAYYSMYSGNLDIANMFGQFMRFFSNDLYLALDRINKLLPSGKQSDNLAREIGTIAAEGFEQNSGGRDVETMITDGSILSTLNKLTNKDNRFGIVMKIEDMDILRACQTYMTLVDSLGEGPVLEKVFGRAIDHIKRYSPELTYQENNPMGINRAIEVISAWLERIAERDPGLFSVLSSKMSSEDRKTSEALTKKIEEKVKEGDPS